MSSIKDTMKALEARIEALEARLAALPVSDTKGKRKAKTASDSEEKPKREFKPSAARDAWRALCDSVRAVHKKDAMKIAKILKEAGHMTPTAKQIEEAIAQFEEGKTEGGGEKTPSGTDLDMTSASEAEEEEKPAPPPVKKPVARKGK